MKVPALRPRNTVQFILVCLILLAGIEFVTTRPGTTLLYQTDFRSFYSAGYLIRTDRNHLYDLDHQNRAQNENISAWRDRHSLFPSQL